MSKRKWYTKAIYLGVALAMTVGLLMVPAVAAPLPDSEPAASPDTDYPGLIDIDATATVDAVGWVTALTGQVHDDEASVHIKLPADATNDGLDLIHKEIHGSSPLLLADITEIEFWEYVVTAGGTPGYGAGISLFLDMNDDDAWDWTDDAQIVFESPPGVSTAAWAQRALGTTYRGFEMGGGSRGIGGYKTLAEWAATAYGTDVVLWVGIDVGWGDYGDYEGYFDDITITQGSTDTYLIEPLLVDLEPDLAMNVKGAIECFKVFTNLVEADNITYDWTVIGTAELPFPGAINITGGGTTADDEICIQAADVGEGHVSIQLDVCESLSEIEVDTLIGGILYAEKKWGEIWCTELESVALDTNVYDITDTVYAMFLNVADPCPADDAVVSFWLMHIDALPDVLAVEAALGTPCPCEEENCGCGTWVYDPTLPPSLQPNDPFILLDDIATANLVPDDSTSFIDFAGQVFKQEITNVDGEVYATVTAEPATSVMLVTHSDYPVSKHGENIECVEHETWIVPPPPTLEKFPLIAWVGEKTVVEWNLGPGYELKEVTFASERPYSVGVLEDPDIPANMGDVVTVMSDDEGIARCIVHSDKSGKTNIVAAVSTAQLSPKQMAINGTFQQGFIVYWIAFESVELKNIEESDLPNPAWDVTGRTEEMLDVGASTNLRARVKGYFVDPDPEWQSTRPVGVLDFDGDGEYDVVLPAGRWVLPDDWNTLAGGVYWQVQKPHWDLMDELDDAVWTMVDAVTKTCDELGPYDDEDVNSPSKIADYPVIGPFSTAQPCTALQWVTTPASVLADLTVLPDGLRTTVVPNYECNEFDAVMPPARLYIVADSGALSTEDKGSIYYDMLPCEDFPGEIFKAYSFPYYEQEIPSSWLINPYYGEGAAGYRWDSWDVDTDAPVGVKGPYEFYEGLPLWAFDYTVINNSFGLEIDAEDEQLLAVYTDNHGEAWAEFTMTTIGTTTIQALATYPFLVGDFVPVISNEVTKTAVDLKDVKVAVETVDEIRDLLYVFVRNYDGTPATCEEVEWAVDGPYGTIEELYEGDEGTSCDNACLDVTCLRDIAAGSRSATGCTRLMTADEISDFTGAYIDATRVLSDTGTLLFDPAVDEDPADYAIAGIKVLSSLGEDVDILIKVHDCWEGEEVIMVDDQVLLFGEPELDNPAVADGLDHCLAVVVMVYNFDNATKTWSWYNPDWPAASNTIATLYKGKAYWVKVSANCTLLYGNQSYDLTTGWNNIPWQGY